MSFDRLIEKIAEKRNPTVAGLDPRIEYLPEGMLARHTAQKGETLEAAAGAFLEFNRGLMDALADIVPAVKLQSACYEALGPAGLQTLKESAEYASGLGLYVIIDAKRGDIGSTAESYSAAYLGRVKVGNTEHMAFPCDALTVNPYLGSDNLNEFLKDCDKYGKAVFVLCKTSNKSSSEVQELMAGDRPLYRVIADQIDRAGAKRTGEYGYSSAGVVVGATQPAHLRELRERYPALFFLVPGYGAQGGAAADIAGAFDKRGRGAVVNNSRGLMCAWQKANTADYTAAAREAALFMRDAIRVYVTIQ
ncbi:MAG: orotidine-5'-phosphate decarboxylase [Oscillospiraceae bacterium]|jgi:orotidine-5'-phosphate decarboxylase|nr:orotidine-5'-phosphate decarboxylase [Oscillospiraceae bacterium]